MKRKIVRVFEVTKPAPKAPKHNLSEIFGMFKKKPVEVPQDDHNEHGLQTDGESATQVVLDRIFSIPSDSYRCVLFLKPADLKGKYFFADVNGGQQIADMIDDADFAKSVSSKSPVIDGWFTKVSTPEFTLDDVTGPFSNFRSTAVLLNVRKATFEAYLNATDVKAKRSAFAAVLGLKNYVAVLDTVAIKAAKVGSLANVDVRAEKFNVMTFIKSYPLRAIIDAARAEHDEKTTPSIPTSDQEIIDTVSDRALNFIFKTLKKGPLATQTAKKQFNVDLQNLIRNAPEIEDREKLIPIIVDAVMNSDSLEKADAHDLLNGLAATLKRGGKAPSTPAPASSTSGSSSPSNNSSGNAPPIEPSKFEDSSAEAIAAALAAHRSKAREAIKILRTYSGMSDL